MEQVLTPSSVLSILALPASSSGCSIFPELGRDLGPLQRPARRARGPSQRLTVTERPPTIICREATRRGRQYRAMPCSPISSTGLAHWQSRWRHLSGRSGIESFTADAILTVRPKSPIRTIEAMTALDAACAAASSRAACRQYWPSGRCGPTPPNCLLRHRLPSWLLPPVSRFAIPAALRGNRH